jgi:hypothetical protein
VLFVSTIFFSVKLLSETAMSRDSSVGIATDYGLDGRGSQEIFLFSTVPRLSLGPILPLIQCVPRTLSPGVKRPECKAEHSPESTAEAKNGRGIPLFSHTSSWHIT